MSQLFVEPPERPQGSPASSSVWREDPGLLSRPCRKRRPSLSQAAAAAKSLQSCPTLCDPIDGSPPGSPVSGILQERTLEWVDSLEKTLMLGGIGVRRRRGRQRMRWLDGITDSIDVPSGCEGKLGVALESLQGLRDLT